MELWGVSADSTVHHLLTWYEYVKKISTFVKMAACLLLCDICVPYVSFASRIFILHGCVVFRNSKMQWWPKCDLSKTLSIISHSCAVLVVIKDQCPDLLSFTLDKPLHFSANVHGVDISMPRYHNAKLVEFPWHKGSFLYCQPHLITGLQEKARMCMAWKLWFVAGIVLTLERLGQECSQAEVGRSISIFHWISGWGREQCLLVSNDSRVSIFLKGRLKKKTW